MFRTRDEMRLLRFRALVALFQKTDRILSGKDVKCDIDMSSNYAPAWTAGVEITFADQLVGEMSTAEDIVRMSGLNYHELGHAMHSPYLKTESDNLATLVKSDPEAQQAYNILEDQRQESMVVATWPSTRHYLTAMFVEYIMDRKERDEDGKPVQPDHSTTFLLSHGRRYLGSEIRDALKNLFVDQSLVGDFSDVIDRYRALNLDRPVHRDTATLLIQRFIDLSKRLPADKSKAAMTYEHITVKTMPDGKSGGRKTPQQIQQSEEAAEGVKDGKDDRDNIDAEGEGQEFGEDGDEDAEGNSNGTDWRENEALKGGGKGAGSGKRDDGDHGDEELNGAISNALNEILKDQEVKRELAHSQAAIEKMDMPEPIKDRLSFRNVQYPEVATAARRMGRKLQMLVEQQDPGWVQRTPSGRLNIRRALTSDTAVDELFDLWDEGNNDASSVEAVVALDTSSSMDGLADQLSRAAWAIKRSFDSVNAPCTIYDFSTSSKLVYAAHDKTGSGLFPRVFTSGGTHPHRVIVEGARRLASSKRKKKLFIVMTDGQWYGQPDPDPVIEEMNKNGILTALAFLPTGAQKGTVTAETVFKHSCQVVKLIDELTDLVDLTNQLVRLLINRR